MNLDKVTTFFLLQILFLSLIMPAQANIGTVAGDHIDCQEDFWNQKLKQKCEEAKQVVLDLPNEKFCTRLKDDTEYRSDVYEAACTDGPGVDDYDNNVLYPVFQASNLTLVEFVKRYNREKDFNTTKPASRRSFPDDSGEPPYSDYPNGFVDATVDIAAPIPTYYRQRGGIFGKSENFKAETNGELMTVQDTDILQSKDVPESGSCSDTWTRTGVIESIESSINGNENQISDRENSGTGFSKRASNSVSTSFLEFDGGNVSIDDLRNDVTFEVDYQVTGFYEFEENQQYCEESGEDGCKEYSCRTVETQASAFSHADSDSSTLNFTRLEGVGNSVKTARKDDELVIKLEEGEWQSASVNFGRPYYRYTNMYTSLDILEKERGPGIDTGVDYELMQFRNVPKSGFSSKKVGFNIQNLDRVNSSSGVEIWIHGTIEGDAGDCIKSISTYTSTDKTACSPNQLQTPSIELSAKHTGYESIASFDSENITVNGALTDKEGEPLSDTEVFVSHYDTKRELTTDSQGHFSAVVPNRGGQVSAYTYPKDLKHGYTDEEVNPVNWRPFYGLFLMLIPLAVATFGSEKFYKWVRNL